MRTLRLDHAFGDEALLAEALTHPSYATEHPGTRDYQRLELLGDAVVKLVTTETILAAHPEWTEGLASQAVHHLVSTATLAAFAEAVGVGPMLRLGRGEFEQGGRAKPKILEDAFEAVIGAVYTEGGLDAARRVLVPLVGPALAALPANPKHPKNVLLEHCQARGIRYALRVLAESGEGNEKSFTVGVTLDGEERGVGTGPSKKKAEAIAVDAALRSLGL